MPYLGQQTADNFQSTTAVQRFNGDGSDTTFTLTTAVSSVQDVLVSVDGVVQDTAAYTIPDGTTLTFTAAPSSGTGNIFVIYIGRVFCNPTSREQGQLQGWWPVPYQCTVTDGEHNHPCN